MVHVHTCTKLLKLFSGYGKQAENVAKHRQNRLYDALDDVVKDEKSPFFNKMSEVYDESDDIACYLTNLTKAVVKDDKPVHIGVAILQWSKLLFLRLVMVTNICHQHLFSGSCTGWKTI